MELHSITTADGKEYQLNDKTLRFVLEPTPADIGLPGVDYSSKRFYQQDGETELAFFLRPRRFSLQVTQQTCNRQELFEARQNLINFLRPNRNGLLTYTFINEAGVKRAIMGRALTTPFSAGGSDEWDEFSYTGKIQIQCQDATWFDPTAISASVARTPIEQLVFPITFPIKFGSDERWGQADITYAGSWYSYPVIRVYGAFDRLVLTHQETGYVIDYLGSIAAGGYVEFDLRHNYDSNGNYVGATIKDHTGANRFGYLNSTSNILKFRIEPDGVVSDGTNTITLDAPGFDTNTTFTLSYYTRYIGI